MSRRMLRSLMAIVPRDALMRVACQSSSLLSKGCIRYPIASQGTFRSDATPSSSSFASQAIPPSSHANTDHQAKVTFDSLLISQNTKKAIEVVFGYQFCTKVQAQALPVCLSGSDVLAKAKTGAGKTFGFMIPAIELLLKSFQGQGRLDAWLAMQIMTETEKLLRFHDLKVQVVMGGTNIQTEVSRLESQTPQIVIATPGRALDHLQTGSLAKMTKDMRMVIFDEADTLLDMGFRMTIEKILALLPPKSQRQTLLFSATFPNNLASLCKFAFKPDYKTVDTIGIETGTNVQVDQLSRVVAHDQLMPYLLATIRAHIRQDPAFKIIVFFPTARTTGLYSETFNVLGLDVLEMHSRKSQTYRNRISNEFRVGLGTRIMFSSDVSARGVDYPDVTLVVQVGLPSDKDQYVHRVGRTARAGKTGQALILLADYEASFLQKLEGLPIRDHSSFSQEVLKSQSQQLRMALSKVDESSKSKAYTASLGYYKGKLGEINMTTAQLVECFNDWITRVIGCS